MNMVTIQVKQDLYCLRASGFWSFYTGIRKPPMRTRNLSYLMPRENAALANYYD